MNISVSQEQARVPVTILRLAGRVSLDTTPELKQAAQDAFQNGARFLLLDLSAVETITSAGLSALHSIYAFFNDSASREAGAALSDQTTDQPFKSRYVKLLSPAPHVRRVLEMTGFDIFLEIYDGRQEAIASF
jgi:anti-anti-sigma regulatory factor